MTRASSRQALRQAYRTRVVPLGAVMVSQDPYDAFEISEIASGLVIAAISKRPMVSGVLHVLLPDVSVQPETVVETPTASLSSNLSVSAGMPALLEHMARLDATPERCQYFLIGGSHFFAPSLNNGENALPALSGNTGALNIGLKNVVMAQMLLRQAGISIAGKDTGGQHMRQVLLRVKDGVIDITSPGRPPKTFHAS